MSKLQEIADLAQVSKATVSRVINNNGNVSTSAKQKVLDAMSTLNLQAHEVKRHAQRSSIIGLVMPFSSTISNKSFGMDIIAGAEERAFENDYMLLIANSRLPGKENAALSQMIDREVDGIILLSKNHSSDHLQGLEQSGIPFVLIDQKLEGISAHRVRGDNFLSTINLMDYLYSIGHTRIAMASPSKYSTYRDRIRGFQMAMMDKGRQVGPGNLIELDEQMTIQQAMGRLLDQPERPTAIYIGQPSDLMAAVEAIHQHGLSIPEDIQIVTFDDEYAPLPGPYQNFFTSINQPAKTMGHLAADLLFQQMKDPDMQHQEVVLPGTLTVRKSTRPGMFR